LRCPEIRIFLSLADATSRLAQASIMVSHDARLSRQCWSAALSALIRLFFAIIPDTGEERMKDHLAVAINTPLRLFGL
jgi:hypothetical protein